MTLGIADIGVYLPRLRLDRAAIAGAHAWAKPALKAAAKGRIAAANWDEDSVTMAHAAARNIGGDVSNLRFCSTSLPFADRSHGAVLVEALELGADTATLDATASERAATSALLDALAGDRADVLVVAAERRVSQPASDIEITRGDAAVAVRSGTDDLKAEYVDGLSHTTDFVGRYRSADGDFDYTFEERWVREVGFLEPLPGLIAGLLDKNGIKPDAIKRLVVNAPARLRATLAKRAGLTRAETALDADERVGDTGSAMPLLGLAEALESAKAGDLLLVAGFGQGVDLLLLRATGNKTTAWSEALATGVDDDNYLRYLSHRDLLPLDWGKRVERDVRTAQSAYYRQRDQIAAFVGGRCQTCGTVQFPRTRACVNPECRQFETQAPYSFADLTGTVKSFTEDWQAYSPAPPLIYGNVTFTGGANILMQFTDTDSGSVEVGDRVRMHFRIKDIDRARGYRRYFWKAVKTAGD